MRPTRRLYIALCQRTLAVGVVVVALVPASGVVSLDVVGVAPTSPVVPRQPLAPTAAAPCAARGPADGSRATQFEAYAEETTHESEVPTAPVDPVVKEVALTPKKATRRGARRRRSRPTDHESRRAAIHDRGRQRADRP